MSKLLDKVFVAASVLICAGLMLFVSVLVCHPWGNFVFSLAAGSSYRRIGDAALEAQGYPRDLAVYKAKRKPFLIVGPCLFHGDEDEEDFFFVNKTQVIRTATDKGGDMWGRAFGRLFIMDDLSDCEVLRAPWWDELKCDKGSRVRYDGTTESYVYSFRLNDGTIPATLTIPAKFFTPDMIGAPNRTLKN